MSSATFPARLAEALEQVGGLIHSVRCRPGPGTIYKLPAGDAEPKIGTAGAPCPGAGRGAGVAGVWGEKKSVKTWR
jgi:hypothetical protein